MTRSPRSLGRVGRGDGDSTTGVCLLFCTEEALHEANPNDRSIFNVFCQNPIAFLE